MTASPNRTNLHHKATEEDGDQGILGKEIWRMKRGQQIQAQLEEDENGSTRQSWKETSGLWPQRVTKHTCKSSKSKSSVTLAETESEIHS